MASMLGSFKNRLHQTYKKAAESVMSTLEVSQFEDSGVLTPEEFILAGDNLLEKCPTWAWNQAASGHAFDFLPEDKQFLITRQVPCPRRCQEVQEDLVEEQVEVDDEEFGDHEGWCNTFSRSAQIEEALMATENNEIPTLDSLDAEPAVEAKESDGTIPTLEDLEEELEEEDDDAVVNFEDVQNDDIIRYRTYDISISYDKYYQVPHVWLRGYDEYSNPLTTDQILEDISSDHKNKTATVENHPHLSNVLCVSIHPCRHAEVMKTISDRMRANKSFDVTVEQYLFLFLKFLSAVIPTMQYDYTLDIK